MTNLENENQGFVEKVDETQQISREEINILDYVQTIADNFRLLIVGPLIVGFTALVFSFFISPTYTAKTQFLPPQQQQSAAASMLASLGNLGGLGNLAGAVGGIKNPNDQFIAYMKSTRIQDLLIQRFELVERYGVTTRADARVMLTEKIKFTSGKDGLISVEADDKEPEFAAKLANAHVEELGKLLGIFAITEAQKRRQFFENQLKNTKEKLVQSEIELKKTGISRSVLKSNPISALTTVANLQGALTVQEIKIASMRGIYAPTSPELQQALKELNNLKSILGKQEKDSDINIDKSGIDGDYVTKYREYKYQETLFELFTKQFEIAKVDEAREGALIQVLDVAQVPEKKTKPKKTSIIIIAILGSEIILLIFIMLRKYFNKYRLNDKNKIKIENIIKTLKLSTKLI